MGCLFVAHLVPNGVMHEVLVERIKLGVDAHIQSILSGS